MTSYTIVIGNKNYSSWSMRAWLALKATGVSFKEVNIVLRQKDSKQNILQYSPSGSVPMLFIDNRPVWDSLAIAETLAEQFPDAKLWPTETAARMHARSASAEMHSSFQALRSKHPMEMSKREIMRPDADVHLDINRIEQIWREARGQFGISAGGPFLYGNFTIADAMYAPVVSRFITYGFTLSDTSKHYMDAIVNLPIFQEWYQAALKETAL